MLRFLNRPQVINIAGRPFVNQRLNTIFAVLYLLGSQPIAHRCPHGFGGAFFCSVETLSTAGYGDIHPQTVYAHLVATVEIFAAMASTAVITGLIFAAIRPCG